MSCTTEYLPSTMFSAARPVPAMSDSSLRTVIVVSATASMLRGTEASPLIAYDPVPVRLPAQVAKPGPSMRLSATGRELAGPRSTCANSHAAFRVGNIVTLYALELDVAGPQEPVTVSYCGAMLVQTADRLSITPDRPVSAALISSSIFARFGIDDAMCGLIVRMTTT